MALLKHFDRIRAGQTCCICRQRIPLGKLAKDRHMELCRLKEDDEDVKFDGAVRIEQGEEVEIDVKLVIPIVGRLPMMETTTVEVKKEPGVKPILPGKNPTKPPNRGVNRRSEKLEPRKRTKLSNTKGEGDNKSGPSSSTANQLQNSAIGAVRIEPVLIDPTYETTGFLPEDDDASRQSAASGRSNGTIETAPKSVRTRIRTAIPVDNALVETKTEPISPTSSNSRHATASIEIVMPPPYFVKYFELILQRIFFTESDENHDAGMLRQFWGAEMAKLERFWTLSGSAKKLFVRLFLRKRKWLSPAVLNYPGIADDLLPIFEELLSKDFVEDSDRLTDLTDAINLLPLSGLRIVAKLFKLDISLAKPALVEALLKQSQQRSILGASLAANMLNRIKMELGRCFQLRADIRRFFMAVFILYAPIEMNSALLLDEPGKNLAQQLLFTLLQAETQQMRYPAPATVRRIYFTNELESLFCLVDAMDLETSMSFAMVAQKWQKAHELAVEARKALMKCFQSDRHTQLRTTVPRQLLGYTDVWVLTRCVSHGVDCLERLRNYKLAVEWLRFLLDCTNLSGFCLERRGLWWTRLALNLDAHLKDKFEALAAARDGCSDVHVREKDRLTLQDRGERLTKKTGADLLVNVCLLKVTDPEKVEIMAMVLSKNLADARQNHFMRTAENGDEVECSVEQAALDHYLTERGYAEGVHMEGTVWHSLFGLLCYDIIFDHRIGNVWLSEVQAHPCDLNTPDFYPNRKVAFDERLEWIEHGATPIELAERLEQYWREHNGQMNSEIVWECFTDLDQAKRLLSCCPGRVLASVFRRLITDYRHTRSGFPDLTLWNGDTGQLAVVEVKGPGDHLSTKQRLWLHYFNQWGVTAHVCHVAARKTRRLD